MTWRLVAGVVALERRSLIGAIVMAGLMSRPGVGPASMEWLMGGVVMWIAAGAGAYTALSRREVVVLPVGPTELHRAGWILAAALPFAVLTLARIVGGGWHAAVSDDGWVFHATPVRVLFDIVYFSVIGAAAVRTPERHQPDFREDPNLYPFIFGTLVMAILPFVVIPWLPERLSDVPVFGWAVGAAALGYGVAPLLGAPATYRRNSPPVTAELPARPPVRTQGSQVSVPASHIQGVWVPLRGVAGQALMWAVVMLGFAAVIGSYVKPAFTLWGPFDASITDLRFLTAFGMLPMFLIGLSPGLASWIPALKRLPLSSRQTALLLSLAPASMPVIYWAALFVIHLVTAWQWPDVWRLGLLAMLVGTASLADALGTKGGSSMIKMAAGATVIMAFGYGMDEYRPALTAVVAHWALPFAGVFCFALSWLINVHTLTRSAGSSRAFRFNRSWQSAGART